ncbi:MAG: RelA/SpoT family protein [Muribaculaceae bacterium]|nr:RelA/SpoT family protein [Muribaculaceae bacterium]
MIDHGIPERNLPQPDSQAEEQIIEEAFQDVLRGYLQSNHRKKVEIIERAYRFAKEAHKGIRRRSGEPYILHPIAVARIASQEIGLGSTSICAALLHDVVEDTDYTVDDIRQNFGAKIAQLVDGLTKISGGIFGDKASAQAENFRKLLLTMSEDIRVVLLKMADRLHNMRTLGSMAPAKQYKIAGETLYIYAPLAHRLGLFGIKTELEDLSFKYEHPAAYEDISSKIQSTEAGRHMVYRDFAMPIENQLHALGINFEAKYRLKSVYSIWRKMQTKNIPFEEVYDLYAMRIIFDCDDPASEKHICWQIYSAITDIYKLHPDRTRDWISVPKANGYQALHLTVMGNDGNWVEIQIRSRRMDDIAERGFAAHWKYKVGEGDEESELTVWLRTIKDILDNPEPSAIDFLDTLKLNLFASEIVVFTPKGELLTLPSGATVLDVAFSIHNEVGLRCIAGKVNHKLVPLNHRLCSGDQVEVLTSQHPNPQPEWESFLVTAKARTRLRQALRRDRQPQIEQGRERFCEALREYSLSDSNELITKVMGYYKLNSRDEIYLAISRGQVDIDEALAHIARRNSTSLLKKILRLGLPSFGSKEDADEMVQESSTPVINRKETYRLRTSGPDGADSNYSLAQCCNPIPGDDVMGFIEDDGTVTVHSLTCPRAAVLKATYGSRILSTAWEEVPESRFVATVQMEGIDRHGILQELISMISSQLGIDIRQLSIEATDRVFTGRLVVRVSNASVVDELCSRVKSLNGVKSATRI